MPKKTYQLPKFSPESSSYRDWPRIAKKLGILSLVTTGFTLFAIKITFDGNELMRRMCHHSHPAWLNCYYSVLNIGGSQQ